VWLASDHIDELGFAADARQVIKAAAAFNKGRGSFDWLHVNSATYLGPNRWFDQGDTRFAPNHVIIGQHHAHLIPKGLPGAGTCWCSTTAARAGTALPIPLRPMDGAHSRGPRHGCSRSIR
jgi:hypothetical protein